MKNIVLIGMPGCGKSLIGNIVSQKLGIPFIDTDSEIEEEAGMDINTIFSTYGEKYFRDLETSKVREISLLNGNVVSTGGGVITREENMNYLKENGIVIWIKRDLWEIYSTLNKENRPLLKNKDEKYLKKLYDDRADFYELYSDHAVENYIAEKSAEEIIELVNSQ